MPYWLKWNNQSAKILEGGGACASCSATPDLRILTYACLAECLGFVTQLKGQLLPIIQRCFNQILNISVRPDFQQDASLLQAGQAKIFRCSRMYIENVSAFNVSGSRQPLYKNFAKQQMINIKYVLYLIRHTQMLGLLLPGQ